MKKETVLIAVVAAIIGLLGGFLIFSLSNANKAQQEAPSISPGAGSPTDYTRRIAEAEKIVAQDPKSLNAWISLGNDYFDTEQAQKAIYAYGKALELDPKNPNVLTDQGVMFRKVGWYDKAIANFEKSLQIDPKHLQSMYNIGLVYAIDMKKPEKAVPYWNQFLKIDSSSATANQIKGMLSQFGSGTPPVGK